jgi:hypothetical protein
MRYTSKAILALAGLVPNCQFDPDSIDLESLETKLDQIIAFLGQYSSVTIKHVDEVPLVEAPLTFISTGMAFDQLLAQFQLSIIGGDTIEIDPEGEPSDRDLLMGGPGLMVGIDAASVEAEITAT